MTDKPKKEISFARPVFSAELMTEDGKKRFDALPAWQRHLIKRVIDHGDLSRAAQESGVGAYAGKSLDTQKMEQRSIVEALNHGGVTTDLLTTHLLECLEAKCIKFDKHQNPINVVDLKLKLETLKTIFELRGDFKKLDKPPAGGADAEQLFEDTEV